MTAATFQCELCHGVFEYDEGWSDKDAEVEMRKTFGEIPLEDRHIVCEDCYQSSMARLRRFNG